MDFNRLVGNNIFTAVVVMHAGLSTKANVTSINSFTYSLNFS